MRWCNSPSSKGLRPLWDKFDDEQQNDASHFLQELVGLAAPTRVSPGYHQVDYAQQVHQRRAFPVRLIFPDQHGSEDRGMGKHSGRAGL